MEAAGSQLSFADARTRLEGAVERLEALEPKLRGAHVLLSSPRWRTELSTVPEATDGRAELLARAQERKAAEDERTKREPPAPQNASAR